MSTHIVRTEKGNRQFVYRVESNTLTVAEKLAVSGHLNSGEEIIESILVREDDAPEDDSVIHYNTEIQLLFCFENVRPVGSKQARFKRYHVTYAACPTAYNKRQKAIIEAEDPKSAWKLLAKALDEIINHYDDLRHTCSTRMYVFYEPDELPEVDVPGRVTFG